MWNALLAGIVYQHESLESLLRELARNPSLMQACGFDPLPIQRAPEPQVVTGPDTGVVRIEFPPPPEPVRAVPASWNVSRFRVNVIALEEALGMVSEMAPILREPLMAALPDFGTHLGFDGTDIASHSAGQKDRASAQTSDPDADWGHHETGGIDARTGKAWKKIKRWFGKHPMCGAVNHDVIRCLNPPWALRHAAVRGLPRRTGQTQRQRLRACAPGGVTTSPVSSSAWGAGRLEPPAPLPSSWSAERRPD